MERATFKTRHDCIVYIRDNYPDVFELLSECETQYNLDDYTGYDIDLGFLLDILNVKHFYHYNDFYKLMVETEDLYTKVALELL